MPAPRSKIIVEVYIFAKVVSVNCAILAPEKPSSVASLLLFR